MTRRLLFLLCLWGAVAGCGQRSRVEIGAQRQILHIGNGAEPKDLDPETLETSNDYTISTALFEGLVNIANDGQTILPGVAERWEISADGLTYTFHLRQDARWSDGAPVTAEDFLYSFRRVFEPKLACENALYGFAIAGARDYASGRNHSAASLGIKAVDARTFQVRLENPTPYILYILAAAPFVPVPAAVVERFGGGERRGTAWTQPGNLVSNGAFTLSAWHLGQDVVVSANPFYWDRAHVRLKEIHFYPIADPETEERAYRSGQLHATFSLPISKIAVYRQRGTGELHITPELNTGYLLFNVGHPPFDDVRVRRAFSLAIDRDRLISKVMQEAGVAAHSLTRPGTGGYDPPRLADHDPSLARRLLAEAGYPGGAGFPRVEFRIPPSFRQDLAEALQQAWRQELGVHVTLAPIEQKTFFDTLASKNFQLAGMTFFYAINAPEAMLMVPLSDSPFNFAGWKSSAFDLDYARDARAVRPDERKAAEDAMERLVDAEAPYAPLYFVNQCFLVSPRVRGWRDNALGQIDWRSLSLEPSP